MLTWELIGAVIGAGFASGREIASFFSQYGVWSIAGIIAAVIALISLADVTLPEKWRQGNPGKVWRLLLSLLLIATAGAMLSGAGEVVSLVVPVHGAYWAGLVGTLLMAWFLANRTISGLAWISRILLAVLAVLIGLGFTVPPMQAVHIDEGSVPEALLRGVTYGGFNAALQNPILTGCDSRTSKERRRAAALSGVTIGLLLTLGNAVLLRHPALLTEPMPFIRLMTSYGKFGYWFGALSLYLAILSTLTACMRGLGGSALSAAAVVLVALLGFTGMVETVYPLLGGVCFLMLAAVKITNSSGKPFISRQDML